MPKTTTLLEIAYGDSPRQVDRQAGIIHGVKILGAVSRNGRTYSETAMTRAVTLYEGATVNIDHPQRGGPLGQRGLAEGFGELKNVAKKDGGVYGDLHFVKSHPMAEQVCERAERFPHKLGLSHNAEGVVSSRDGKMIVEDIQSVRSVDIVGCPATSDGLFESHQPPTAEDADSQIVQLQEEVARLRAEHECRDLLEAANIASDPVRIKALLPLGDEERRALIRSWPRRTGGPLRPRSSEPLRESQSEYTPKGGKRFAAAIR
jgi:hypothetical protein